MDSPDEWRKNFPMWPAPFDDIIRERRATRHFTTEPVPDRDLDIILQDALQAPSGFNLQPWRFLVLRDAESRARLRKAANNQEKITEAPVVVIAFAPHQGWQEKMSAVFAERVQRNALEASQAGPAQKKAVAFVHSLSLPAWLNRQVMIAFTHLMLAAETHGWNTAPMEGFDADAVRRAFDFPADTEIIALLAIGRASDMTTPYPGRLPVSELVYSENLQTHWKIS